MRYRGGNSQRPTTDDQRPTDPGDRQRQNAKRLVMQTDRALTGLKVLDLSDGPGQLTGRILAELGAEVLKIEPPGGDALRKRGPFIGGEPHPDCGAQWVARNLGKRSMVLDLAREDGARRLRELARLADVL